MDSKCPSPSGDLALSANLLLLHTHTLHLLLLHTHTLHLRRLPTAATATSAFDPNTGSWTHLPPGPSPALPLRSSDHLLYTLSSSQLSFSSDPLHLRWTHLPSPGVWRVDPVVALVGPHLVVAGGVSEFEDDPLAVEVYAHGRWRNAGSMPAVFKRSASSYYLAAAVTGGRLHVVEKQSGLSSSFDPVTGKWSEPVELLSGVEKRPFAVAVAAAGSDLVVAGVMGQPAELTGIRFWLARREAALAELGEMPEDMLTRFTKGPGGNSAAGITGLEVRAADAGGWVYVYNPSDIGEIFHFRAGAGGGEWGAVVTGVDMGFGRTKTVVVSCSSVKSEELREALRQSPATGV